MASEIDVSLAELAIESPGLLIQQAIAATKTWLVECERDHKSCRKKPRFSKVSDMGSPLLGMAHIVRDLDQDPKSSMPKRLLSFDLQSHGRDVVMVIDTVEAVPYVALSYRWGQKNYCKATKDNLEELQTEGILLEKLPRTFRDAIEFTRGLGYSKLWIDALCILQGRIEDDFSDSSSASDGTSDVVRKVISEFYPNNDFIQEAPRMACIYGNSIFTIAAMDGVDCDSGLFLLPSLVPHQDQLSSRAWVLQERMIPPRSLLFTNNSVTWECRQCSASLSSRHFKFRNSISLDNPKDLLTFFRDWRIPGANIQEDQDSVIYLEDDLKELRAHPTKYYPFMQAWWKFIARYTACRLSYDMDKFQAMSGVANIALRWVHMVNYFGLWGNWFHSELAWYVEKDGPEPSRPDGFLVPSWSWASIRNGRVGNSFWEYNKPELASMQMKPSIRPPQSTSFDIPLPYPPWSSILELSVEVKGTLREGTITSTRGEDSRPRYDVHLETYARWSDEEVHEFWPDCPNEFPMGSTVSVHVLHLWHYHDQDRNGYRDVRLVLRKLDHVGSDPTSKRITFRELHYSPDHPAGQEWGHQLGWNRAGDITDEDEEFLNGRTFLRKGLLVTTYPKTRDMEGIDEDVMWHTVRLL